MPSPGAAARAANKIDRYRTQGRDATRGSSSTDEAGPRFSTSHYLPAKRAHRRHRGARPLTPARCLRGSRARDGRARQDIVGGLPRVTEIFEARKPKDAARSWPRSPAPSSSSSDKPQGQDDDRHRQVGIGLGCVEHHVPAGTATCNVHTGDARRGRRPDHPTARVVPQDILRIKGEEALYNYLHRPRCRMCTAAQGVPINDKHIEVISAQMLRKMKVGRPRRHAVPAGRGGRPRPLPVGQRRGAAADEGGRGRRHAVPGGPARRQGRVEGGGRDRRGRGQGAGQGQEGPSRRAHTLLLGITKASLSSDSFISAASFRRRPRC